MAETDQPQAQALPLRLEVVPEPVPAEIGPDVRAALLAHHVVRGRYPNADLWLVALDLLDKEDVEAEAPNLPFHAVLADMAGSAVAEAEGVLWDLDATIVTPTSRPRLPSEDEHAWAAGVVRADPELAPRIDAGEVELYRPIPPLANWHDI